MAKSRVIVEVELELAHADGMSRRLVHGIARSAVYEAFGHIEGKYVANDSGEVLRKKVRKVSDVVPNYNTTVYR